jgi:hypothetical protein
MGLLDENTGLTQTIIRLLVDKNLAFLLSKIDSPPNFFQKKPEVANN